MLSENPLYFVCNSFLKKKRYFLEILKAITQSGDIIFTQKNTIYASNNYLFQIFQIYSQISIISIKFI